MHVINYLPIRRRSILHEDNIYEGIESTSTCAVAYSLLTICSKINIFYIQVDRDNFTEKIKEPYQVISGKDSF